MKSKIVNILLWCLEKLHYQIPVIKPTLIEIKDCKRTITNQRMSWYQIQEWASCSSIDLNKEVERRVREEMAGRIANELKVFKLNTPDGIEWRCDALYLDMEPYERDLKLC